MPDTIEFFLEVDETTKEFLLMFQVFFYGFVYIYAICRWVILSGCEMAENLTIQVFYLCLTDIALQEPTHNRPEEQVMWACL